MISRKTFIATLLPFIACSLLFSIPAHAQEENPICNPACPSGQYCVFNGGATQTRCIANDTLTTDPTTGNITSQEVTVTAPAQSSSGALTFAGIVKNIVTIVNVGIIPLLYALAIIYLMIGIVRYFFIEGGPEAQEKGKQTIMYGLIGIVVIFSIWGLVNIMLNTLNSVAGTNPAITTTPATNTNYTQ